MAPAVPTPPVPQPSTGAAEPASPQGGFARLERFWNDHSETIFRAAYRITGNPADAEDVLQTVFLRLARASRRRRRRPRWPGQSRKRGWRLPPPLGSERGARRRALAPARRLGAARAGSAVGAGGRRHRTPAPRPIPSATQSNRELRANLRLAIARLSPRSAEIFALRYFEDLSNREIASLMGISQGLVAVLLHRTRARLRKELVALEGVVR